MSSRQLEEKYHEEQERIVAKLVGISVSDLGAADWSIEELIGHGGQFNTYYIQFRDGTPENILNKIPDLVEDNIVYLDPWAFSEPVDENYDPIGDNH